MHTWIGMIARKRERETPVKVGAAILGLAAALAGGCAGPGHGAPGAATARDLGPLVFPTDGVVAYERGADAGRYGWFEFGRNNGAVAARDERPILATTQWPLPPRPAERRVRFEYWDQRR